MSLRLVRMETYPPQTQNLVLGLFWIILKILTAGT